MKVKEEYEYNDEVKFSIGQRIQEMRMKKGQDSVVVADYIGVGRNQLSRIENGRANCTVPQLFVLAQMLDCSVDYLMFGKKEVHLSKEQEQLVLALVKSF